MRDGFEAVVKIINNFRQGKFKEHLQPVVGQILVIGIDPPAIQAKLHDSSHVPVRDDDGGANEGFTGGLDGHGVRVKRWIVDDQSGSVLHDQLVLYGQAP